MQTNQPNNQGYNETVMKRLLAEPDVKENVKRMSPAELQLFKKLLVQQGIYGKYLLEKGGK